jgi:acyl-[acyl-carrier-protein]-phospholipid O-acyltransferase/long-chain-fatty-acid--[acyl-carrier-protein] ligase
LNEQHKHPLRGLLVAQFFGAFNDNAWKLFVALLAIRAITAATGESGPAFEAASQWQTMIAFGVFTLPLIFFSLPAGMIADRLSKRSVILAMKTTEIGLMTAGTVALFMDPSGTTLPLIVLGLMGVQSALFSPAKFGILPEILPHERLSAGNAHLAMWTLLAIIAGSAAGGTLLDRAGEQIWVVGLLLTVLAGIGLLAARSIPRVAPARSEGGVAATVRIAWLAMREDRVLRLAVLGSVLLWGLMSLLGQDVLVYVKELTGTHRRSDTLAGLPFAFCGIGAGIGALLAAKLSASKVEYGLIPLGAVGFSLFTLIQGILAPGYTWTLVVMVFVGISSGLLLVPLASLLQWRPSEDRRGAVIALSNVFVFSGVFAGSLSAWALSAAGISASGILIAASIVTVTATIWALWLLPDALLRLIFILLAHTFYRVRVVGRENVPQKGGALLVPNHASFVDGLFLLASLDRPIRFIIEATYYRHPLVKPFWKSIGAIPISASRGPRVILRALRDAGKYLDEGHLVCIFAEGQVTRTGMMLPFRRGFQRIVKGRTTPIVPIHLDRVFGSIFSREGGRVLFKFPKQLPYPVGVSYGKPLEAGASVAEVRRAVHELGAEAWALHQASRPPLHHGFIRGARSAFGGLRLALADWQRPRVSRFKALAGAIALARALRPGWQGQELVGILLPPSVGGALVNIAASMSGRTSVNLNYTAGRVGLQSAANQAGLRTVVTSREFVEKAKVELPNRVKPIWIEDLAAGIGGAARAWAFLIAMFAPIRLIERACGAARRPKIDDVVTVIFSSGSTGEPKGILITHSNVDANVEAVAQVFQVHSHDRILGILPFFHSFGYLTLWFASNHRIGMVCHANPVDAGTIGELVHRYRVTMLLATPTFLQVYLRRCAPAQFGSLRLVMAGAEKLSERLSVAFEDHFGIRPLTGYGTTECAPVIAVSAPDFRAPGFFQAGSRRSFVGHPIPGVVVRIVDPDTFELLPPGTPGLLLVKGSNIMRGYLGRDDLTAQVMRDGWYVTGDIALMNEDGFIKITDRLSRFSKIGGEMVPHGRVEEALQEAAEADGQVFAVTAIPDERKGERLAVLHTLDEQAISSILEKVAASGLPNLFIPRRDQFVKVENLPVLGTGKVDLREVKRIAAETLVS